MQKLIKQKKIEFYNAKLTENIGKPKELWKALKNLGLPSKKSPSTNICLTKDSTTIFAENKNIKIKQYSKVTYLGCILDETLSGESMAIHVINKINSRLRFLYRQNRYLSFPLCRLLHNAMIQPFLIMHVTPGILIL